MNVCNSIKQIDKEQWASLVAQSQKATFFQTESCYYFYESVSFLKPFVFAVQQDGQLKGVVLGYIQQEKNALKHFLTRRAIIPGGALLANDATADELCLLLTTCIRQLRKEAIYIEIRNFHDYSIYKTVFEQNGFRYQPHLNFQIDTTSMDIVLENLGKSRKRDVKTSLRDGAVVITQPTLEQVGEYYAILSELYKTKVKTPLFPFEFFSKLYSLPDAEFILIMLNKQIIGGTVCVGLPNKTLYEWFACGVDGIYKNVFPSTLATYSGIEYAATHGYAVFDMMGAGKPEDEYGVRNFKAKFGGKLVEYGRFLFVSNIILYKIGCLLVKIIKRKR